MHDFVRRERAFAIANRIVVPIFALCGVAVGVYSIFYSTGYYALLGFATLAFLLLPRLVLRLMGLRPTPSLLFTAYAFIALAFLVGMALRGYERIPYYDKLVHTVSGAFFGLVGLGYYYVLKPVKRIEPSDWAMARYFCFSFSMTVAAVWELYEFAISYILGTDPQGVAATGVGDPMADILVCLIGAVLLCISLYFYYRRGKTGFLMGVFESFCRTNGFVK